MSKLSAAGRRSRRAAQNRTQNRTQKRPQSRAKRIAVAIGTVIVVITPISWILLHQPQADQADAAVPYVTRDDDTYVTSSTKPVVARPSATTPGSTPSGTPAGATPTPTPTDGPSTPGQTPSMTPTGGPGTTTTAGPTDGRTGGPTTTVPTDGPTGSSTPRAPQTQSSTPTNSPSSTPSSSPSTSTPPPPADDGNMAPEEVELFTLVDNERAERGCAPLRRNSNLTGGARQDAKSRARSGDVSDNSSSMAAAGGDGVTAKAAFDKLKSASSATLFNCGLRELGVGQATADRNVGALCPLICGTRTRVAWVVDFQ